VRYVIFSDVHGNALAFRSFIEQIESLVYDRLIFLGDFVGYYYEPEEIIRWCREHDVISLRGNHDQYFLDMLDGEADERTLVGRYGESYRLARDSISEESIVYLRTLPDHFLMRDPHACLFLCHGSPTRFLEGRIYPDTDLGHYLPAVTGCDYVICGQTHHKLNREAGDTRFLNPGSLGQQRDGRGCSYLRLDTENRTFGFECVEYDIASLERDVDRHDPDRPALKEVLRRNPRPDR
jgi:putative phosphoesterase